MAVCVLGSLNLDIVCQVADLPLPGETVMGRGPERLLGGKGANQAIAAARQGAATMLIGAVGSDEAGGWLLDHLRASGVDVDHVVRIAGAPTGQAFITVADSGENVIVVIGGANQTLTEAHIRPETLERATVFVGQFETPLAVIEAVFASPAAGRGITILNAAPAVAEGSALFALADILVVNQTELARYAGVDAPDGIEAAMAAARGLISRPDQRVVVTLGAGGAAAIGPDEAFLVAGRAARVVDATGAGDCFCGALAAELDAGRSLRDAMAWANAAAALSTQRIGAGLSAPTRAETETFQGLKAD